MTMDEKLNEMSFALSGGIISALFVLLVDIFLWIKFVPLYNSILISAYGTGGLTTFGIIKAILLSVLLAFVIGGILSWIFAFVYNKLPKFRFAG